MTAPAPRLRPGAYSRRLIPMLADERVCSGVHGAGAVVVRLAAAQALGRASAPTGVSG